MATSNLSAPLNAEPSRPDERKSQGLQPKSYLDAVREDPEEAANLAVNSTSNPSGVNGTASASHDQPTNSTTTGSSQGISVLRIVQTHDDTAKSPGPNDSSSDAAKGTEQVDQEKRPVIERQESKQEYSARVRTR
jgi:hypothetical protein